MLRWIGFGFVVLSGTLTGVLVANDVRKKEQLLQNTEQIFQFMRAEIEFHFTPLQELCEMIGQTCNHKILSTLFGDTGRNMKLFPGTTAGQIVRKSLEDCKMPKDLCAVFYELFSTLGRQDVYAQVRALTYAQERVQLLEEELLKGKHERIRSYRVLGFCTGLAIAVILV